jgi:tRNA(Ile2) C34 agmatinyltransferase TiaS
VGLEDRDYMSEDRSKTHDVKVCPKTGHWIGLSDCSKCEENCYTKKLLFINSSNSIKNDAEIKEQLDTLSGVSPLCPHCAINLSWSYGKWECRKCGLSFDKRLKPIINVSYCPQCQARLDWHSEDALWFCSNCKNYFNQEMDLVDIDKKRHQGTTVMISVIVCLIIIGIIVLIYAK